MTSAITYVSTRRGATVGQGGNEARGAVTRPILKSFWNHLWHRNQVGKEPLTFQGKCAKYTGHYLLGNDVFFTCCFELDPHPPWLASPSPKRLGMLEPGNQGGSIAFRLGSASISTLGSWRSPLLSILGLWQLAVLSALGLWQSALLSFCIYRTQGLAQERRDWIPSHPLCWFLSACVSSFQGRGTPAPYLQAQQPLCPTHLAGGLSVVIMR